MAGVLPRVVLRTEAGAELPMLVWRLPAPALAVASTALGGGIGLRHWVLNVSVPLSYRSEDPDAHLAGLARGQNLDGAGVGFLTGVDVRMWTVAADDGVTAVATVGVRKPEWAAAPDAPWSAAPGTINIVAFVPVRLSDAALVNAVATVTEAKVQAMLDAGLPGTGTATDAVCVLCPPDGPAEQYGGPRSVWGARLARAVHRSVRAGC